jgi:hypothetical protein
VAAPQPLPTSAQYHHIHFLLFSSSFFSISFLLLLGSSRQDDGMALGDGNVVDADANTDADANDGWGDADDGEWGDLPQ